jgi:hypothetical protein
VTPGAASLQIKQLESAFIAAYWGFSGVGMPSFMYLEFFSQSR